MNKETIINKITAYFESGETDGKTYRTRFCDSVYCVRNIRRIGSRVFIDQYIRCGTERFIECNMKTSLSSFVTPFLENLLKAIEKGDSTDQNLF